MVLKISKEKRLEVILGDTISPLTDDTKVEVRHALDSDKKYVTLLSGSADLIKGNYVVK